MGQERLPEADVTQSRVTAHSKARNRITLVPAAQHHVADHAILKASDVIAITARRHPAAKLTSKLTSEWVRMKKADGLGIGGERSEEIAQGCDIFSRNSADDNSAVHRSTKLIALRLRV